MGWTTSLAVMKATDVSEGFSEINLWTFTLGGKGRAASLPTGKGFIEPAKQLSAMNCQHFYHKDVHQGEI